MPRSCRDCLPMMPTELSAVLPARHIQEECGVFGVYAPETTDVAPLAYYALYALQHRGQESAGIAVNDDGVFTAYRDVGLVNEVFPAERLRSLGTGTIAVGHVRYGTTGSDNKRNVQPILVNHYKGRMALAHNGNLTNSHALRQELESQGSIFQTTTDSEVIAYIIVQERLRAPSIEEAVSAAMDRVEGAYSLVISSPTKLIAVRDPHGFRPLCMGRLRDGGVVFASESCALDAIGARFERDILPGEIVVADKSGVKSDTRHCGKVPKRLCVFEFIYFARPDSVIDGSSVHVARQRAGAFLALEHPVQADIVIGVPYWDLSFPAAFKTYLEHVSVCELTFHYTEDARCEGICKAKRITYITTCGGFVEGANFGYEYIVGIAKMFGIPEVRFVAAEGLDIVGIDVQ